MPIPQLSLQEIYGDISEQQAKRYATLKESFTQKYGRAPDFFSRAPGRVNIIGEHIDYHGYGVLPMSINQDIVCAVAVNHDKPVLRLANTQSQYKDFICTVDEVAIKGIDWHEYFLCGWKGVVENASLSSPCGMDVMLDGCVPKSSGLSSSSALVCCAAMCTARANQKEYEQVVIADLCAKCEKYIGTMGGGMDQSICFLGEVGKAKQIEFNPLRATTCHLPESISFVISNSLTEINKAAPCSQFNVRVVEGRAAAQILAKNHGLEWRSFKKLKQVQDALGKSFDEMMELVKAELEPGLYTRQQLQEKLEVTDEELLSVMLSPQTQTVQQFNVHNRAMHVFSEAARVHKTSATADASDGEKELGRLMTESHVSCSQLYECSSPELDELTAICRDAGALGSRLTGAGWGGCAVSVVPTEQLASFLDKVRENFYSKDPERMARVETALFATKPGSGAAYLCL
ncbi:N-acetylgalactosamine kinase-like [Sycon ciliatum]|uniref:N-acetylgalactosamine kinase-like n=1 Tax=Sycon ciliatum TaxID=27933 RepID=UPI0020A86C0E|eukprot:scpid66004/ scgid11467/ N-acetylgalactosamine kinase; GalNAc kinase; Galactokinase 2